MRNTLAIVIDRVEIKDDYGTISKYRTQIDDKIYSGLSMGDVLSKVINDNININF